LKELIGPSFYEQWVYWKGKTSDQNVRSYIKSELDKLLVEHLKNVSLIKNIYSLRGLITKCILVLN